MMGKKWVEKFNEEQKREAPKGGTLTEEQKQILREIRESPRPSPAGVRERQKEQLKMYEDYRDKPVENALKKFAKQIINVKPPEVIAIPRPQMLQISRGVTTYRPAYETIYVTLEEFAMLGFCHELKHHIDYRKKGMKDLAESLRYRYEDIPYRERPDEKRAREFASKYVAKYIEEWGKKVEPVIGSKRIFGL